MKMSFLNINFSSLILELKKSVHWEDQNIWALSAIKALTAMMPILVI
jgi:hypothetical protein